MMADKITTVDMLLTSKESEAESAEPGISPRIDPETGAGPSLASSSTNKLIKNCLVCGDTETKTTRNYGGVLSCNACRSFFQQSAIKKTKFVCQGKQDCDITKQKRFNRCKFCRWTKCLSLGMLPDRVSKTLGRRKVVNFTTYNKQERDQKQEQKQEQINDEANKLKKMTCSVCGDTASKMTRNYGVICCAACRCFFCRVAKEKLKFVCRANQNCNLTEQKKMYRCSYCRWMKCLELGMREKFEVNHSEPPKDKQAEHGNDQQQAKADDQKRKQEIKTPTNTQEFQDVIEVFRSSKKLLLEEAANLFDERDKLELKARETMTLAHSEGKFENEYLEKFDAYKLVKKSNDKIMILTTNEEQPERQEAGSKAEPGTSSSKDDDVTSFSNNINDDDDKDDDENDSSSSDESTDEDDDETMIAEDEVVIEAVEQDEEKEDVGDNMCSDNKENEAKQQQQEKTVDGKSFDLGIGNLPKSKCPHCEVEFVTKYLPEHIERIHKARNLQCPLRCVAAFSTPKNLERHMLHVHKKGQQFECYKCKYKTWYPSNYQLHLKRHQEPTLRCRYCYRSFYTEKTKRKHEQHNCRGPLTGRLFKYECPKCQHLKNNRESMGKHVMKCFGLNKFRCFFKYSDGTYCQANGFDYLQQLTTDHWLRAHDVVVKRKIRPPPPPSPSPPTTTLPVRSEVNAVDIDGCGNAFDVVVRPEEHAEQHDEWQQHQQLNLIVHHPLGRQIDALYRPVKIYCRKPKDIKFERLFKRKPGDLKIGPFVFSDELRSFAESSSSLRIKLFTEAEELFYRYINEEDAFNNNRMTTTVATTVNKNGKPFYLYFYIVQTPEMKEFRNKHQQLQLDDGNPDRGLPKWELKLFFRIFIQNVFYVGQGCNQRFLDQLRQCGLTRRDALQKPTTIKIQNVLLGREPGNEIVIVSSSFDGVYKSKLVTIEGIAIKTFDKENSGLTNKNEGSYRSKYTILKDEREWPNWKVKKIGCWIIWEMFLAYINGAAELIDV